MRNSKLINAIFFISITFSQLSCSKDQEIVRPYPRLQTLEVSSISELGATFNAIIYSVDNQEVIEYGFVWDRSENPTINKSDKRILKGNIVNNEFSVTITSTLGKNSGFYVRAYLKTSDYLVYGKNVFFISKGSGPAIFNSFFPRAGIWGDTIKLSGKYFSIKSDLNKVRFKDLSARIISNTDSTITCIVPRNIEDKTVPIYLSITGEEVQSTDNFELLSPEILSVAPLTATFGDEIIITGTNFSKILTDNQVFFGEAEATIIFASKNVLKVKVPNNLASSSEIIKVISSLQEATYQNNFTLTLPVITSATQEVNANKSITIKVSNFHPITSNNIFTLENIDSNIISGGGDTGEYIVQVPWGPFPRRKLKIKLQVLDLVTEYQLDIDVKDKWAMVSDNLPFSYNGILNNAVVAQGEAYVIAIDKDFSFYYLWKFNPQDFSWEKSNLPFQPHSRGVAESNGTNIYVYLPKTNNEFWEYDTTLEQWSKKSSFSGNKREGATHFSIGAHIYVGLGIDFEPYIRISYADFYKYSPSNDLWTRVSDVPFNNFGASSRMSTASFVINDIGYFTGGGLSTGDIDSWSYNPATDSWTRIADNTHSIFNYNPGIALNGFGYITGNSASGTESWRYDPTTNKWEQSYYIGKPRGGNFSFSLNGKLYIGGGESNFELFEFKP